MEIENKGFLFDSLRKLSETQIGDRRFFIEDKKIREGLVKKIEFTIQSAYILPKVKFEGFIHVTMRIDNNGNEKKVKLEDLFKTKEEAAERFLQENDVPSELLRVIKQEKPKTTISRLIEKLQKLDPETDLGDDYQDILNKIVDKYLGGLKGDDKEAISE